MLPSLDLRHANSLWAGVLVETLARCGIRHAVISPGSRSTPLTLALARHDGIRSIPVLDERSAGFFALGIAKATGRAVVLLCTSGTAAANYFPAIVEASESAVPLLILTADRPPEMRACASGQTIDQQKLYGGYVRAFHELAVPELAEGRLRYLRQTVAHAATRSVAPIPGPVHLNVPFRDPLVPVPDGGLAETFARGVDWERFFSGLHEGQTRLGPAGPSAEPAGFHGSPEAHGVIVVGPNQPVDDAGFATEVGALARHLGWPVLADGLTPLRNHAAAVPHLVTTYELILRDPTLADPLRPEVVIAIGEWPTSKVLRSWLEASDAQTWLVTNRPDNRDALHGRTRVLGTSLSSLIAALPAHEGDHPYQKLWARHERAARARLDAELETLTTLAEPRVAWMLARHLPAGTPLVVGNSMPIRDVEYFWPPHDRQTRILCNRGANGIDGTLSTAMGVAHGLDRATVLLTGDLAFLHDTNGLLLRAKSRGGLTVVLVNNRGGGIFEHLPVAAFDPPFEDYFATPQEVDFGTLCQAHGVAHERIEGWETFVARISTLPERGVRVLELGTDRKADAALRKRLLAPGHPPAAGSASR